MILWGAATAPALADSSATDGSGGGAEGQAPSQLANPAATFCIQNGGSYEIRTAADGAQTGFCVLKDGRTVDAWQFFRDGH